MTTFGTFIREKREILKKGDSSYSLRQVAERVGVQPSYLSRIEREAESPPSEETIVKLAQELELDSDVLLALAGKVSSELRNVIQKRPQLFGRLIRELQNAPDDAILHVVREVRDGEW